MGHSIWLPSHISLHLGALPPEDSHSHTIQALLKTTAAFNKAVITNRPSTGDSFFWVESAEDGYWFTSCLFSKSGKNMASKYISLTGHSSAPL